MADFYIFIFIFGLFIGSFLNCVIYRLEKEKSFLEGRSFCPHCKHTLFWRDLIPVVSFILLKGRCRYCGQKISWQYPAVETATALIFLLIFSFQTPIGSVYYSAVACFLIVIFVYDLKYYIIPDKVFFPALGIAVLYRFLEIWPLGFENFKSFINPLLSGFIPLLFFLAIYLVSRGKWLGFGDVKLVFLLGFFLGFPEILVSLFLSFFFGAIIGIGLILAKRKKLKSEVPFGPFLIAGAFLALFWGEKLANWYLNLFLF